MNHHITETDNLFTVRTPSWHGLEQNVFDEHPTREVARQASLPWEVTEETLYRMVPVVTDDGQLLETYEPIEDFKMTLRDDTNEPLGVVSSGYGLVRNETLFDIAEALESESRGSMPVRYETGGSLKGGRKVFLLVRLEEPLFIKGDPHGGTIPYYALQNAHDGSGAFRGQATFTRIVCDNTARAADLDAQARGTELMFRHTSSIEERIEDAKMALAGWRENLTNWQEMMEHFINVEVTAEQMRDFVNIYIPMPQSETLITDRVKNNINTARQGLMDIFEGPTLEGSAYTAYGLVQGAIEWSQHVRATKGKTELDRIENKFKRAYLDDSTLTRNAVEITKSLLTV